MNNINNITKIKSVIAENEMVLTYFTTNDCNLCKDLFPKIEKMLLQYPNVVGIRAETNEEMQIIGTYNVFTVPTIILFVEGKETIRRSRQIAIGEFSDDMNRYYQMIFE